MESACHSEEGTKREPLGFKSCERVTKASNINTRVETRDALFSVHRILGTAENVIRLA